MKFFSTNNKSQVVTFETALLQGQPIDKGLYVPVKFPVFSKAFVDALKGKTFQEISLKVANEIFKDDIPEPDIDRIIGTAFPFSPELKELDNHDRGDLGRYR
jgi:threonine synthase